MTSTLTTQSTFRPVDDDGPLSREQRKHQTRRVIQAAAIRLFLDRGYDNTTIDEIAEAAGVSARTFYRYFPVKEDVLEFVPPCIVDVFTTTFASRAASGGIVPAIHVVLDGLANAYEDERELLFARKAVLDATPAISRRIESNQSALATEAVASIEGLLEVYGHDVDLNSLQQLLTGMNAALGLAMQRWCSDRGAVPLPTLWCDTVDLFAPAFDALFRGTDRA
jgi:AcrR family transcriptional regulator